LPKQPLATARLLPSVALFKAGGDSMRKTYPIYISKRKEHSMLRYAIRAVKDECLQDDVENFMTKQGGRLDYLVEKLLNKEFILSRYTDQSYPG
jgi:hypothetical protein